MLDRVYPSFQYSDAKNAARLAMWADWAYMDATSTYDTASFLIPWINGNAHGLMACRDTDDLIVAIAGTDDAEDARNDSDVFTEPLSDFCRANGIHNYSGNGRCRVHVGFATYANLALNRVLESVSLGRYRNVWLVGHSLGGAAAVIMRWLLPPTAARLCRVFTFGAPATHTGPHCDPCFGGPVVRVSRISDPVPCTPPGFKHTLARQLFVRYRGSVRPTLTWQARLYRALFVSAGLVSKPLQMAGYHPQFLPQSFWAGHAIGAYRHDLEPFI